MYLLMKLYVSRFRIAAVDIGITPWVEDATQHRNRSSENGIAL
jgi:hypothetical protein